MPIYKIAGFNVKINPIYERTRSNLDKYLTNENDYCADLSKDVEFYVNSTHEKYPMLDLPACEYMVVGAMFFDELLNHNGFVFHSSAVVYNNKAYLFTAPSGTGKSTHTSLWIKYLGDDKAKILNDDKPAIVIENGEVFAYGTPFSGKTDLNINEKYKLGGICYLSQANKNEIRKLTLREFLPKIIEQTHKKNNEQFMDKLFVRIDQIAPFIDFYELKCDISKQAFITSFNAMTGDKYE